ncbi:MAG: hypothetical protein JWP01_4138 [Myxococcales bacterium]|nr:hypothetical protein [Myxococcales bacterium]
MAAWRILTLIICGAIAPAIGSPRSDPTTGRAVFTGAATPHASSLSLNPAALGLGPGVRLEVYFAFTSTLQQLGIERRSLDITTGDFTTTPRVSDTQLAPGGAFSLVGHPSDSLTLGFEARIPPAELFPRNHDELRYHTLGESQRNYLATAGVSFRVTSAFYFGASVTHENTYLRLRYARDTALDAGFGAGGVTSDCGGAPCGVENPEATEIYDVNVSTPLLKGSNLKVNLGTVFRVYPDVWIGLAYHTPPGFDIQSSLDGTLDVTRAPRDGGEVLHGGSTVYVSYPASIDGEVRARLPRELELHVGGRWEDLSRMQALDVRAYGSTFRNAGIPEWMLRTRGLHDSFALWAGVEQIDRGGRYRLGARVGFETSALSAERTSALTIAPPKATIDLGGQLRLGSLLVQLSYGIALSPTVVVGDDDTAFDPRFGLDCYDSGFDYTSRGCEAARTGYALPSAAGEYSRLDHAVRLGFRYALP